MAVHRPSVNDRWLDSLAFNNPCSTLHRDPSSSNHPGSSAMSTRRDRTTQDVILEAIVERLISTIPELNDQTCWVSDQPIPNTLPQGKFAVTVSMGAGRFPAEFFAGGGSSTVTEDGSVVITIILATTLDRPKRAWRRIVGGSSANMPSLLSFKLAILKSLLAGTWEPKADGQPILRDLIAPLSCDDPRDVQIGETIGSAMQMRFSTVFDWRLS